MRVFPTKVDNKIMENTTSLPILTGKEASKLSHFWLDDPLLEFVDMANDRKKSLPASISEKFAGYDVLVS